MEKDKSALHKPVPPWVSYVAIVFLAVIGVGHWIDSKSSSPQSMNESPELRQQRHLHKAAFYFVEYVTRWDCNFPQYTEPKVSKTDGGIWVVEGEYSSGQRSGTYRCSITDGHSYAGHAYILNTLSVDGDLKYVASGKEIKWWP